jgi:hypothetical protein
MKPSDIKFRKSPSRKSRVVPCGRTIKQTVLTLLISDCGNFAKAPKVDSGVVNLIEAT